MVGTARLGHPAARRKQIPRPSPTTSHTVPETGLLAALTTTPIGRATTRLAAPVTFRLYLCALPIGFTSV